MRRMILLAMLVVTLPAATLSLVAGGTSNESDGIPAKEARVTEPFATAMDRRGNLYICQFDGKIRLVDPSGIIRTVAGTGKGGYRGDGGPALQVAMRAPHHILLTPEDELLIADSFNNVVRRYSPASGRVFAFAGTGSNAFGGDGGPAVAGYFRGTFSLDFSPDRRTLYICDLGNRRIRSVDMATGMLGTAAGNGKKGVPGDGSNALECPLVDPRAVCVDSKGRIYIVERGGNALRAVGPDGTLRTVVGTGNKGMAGDGGPALEAEVNGPKHAWPDLEDSILIADTENHLVRRYLPSTGKIERVAGTGKAGSNLDADPLKTELRRPHGVYVDRAGTIYIADSANHRVLKIAK
ncbi:MAG: hypothetical protein J0L75_19855 [Spirochaetes bacterium]|nr:hypothetical protein [Spirochaetota bacterium]